MKIRNGFVSNSSSSSFIIRGAEFSTKELIVSLGIQEDEYDVEDDYDIIYAIGKKLPKDLTIEPTGNMFDAYDFDNLIIGKDCGELEDGGVVELVEHTSETDKEIIDMLDSSGIKIEKLKTYVQMISNDNY